MIYCHTCGASNDPSQNYCLNDGTKLQKDTEIKLSKQSASFCPSCGSQANINKNYCYACGSSFYKRKEGGAGITGLANSAAGAIARDRLTGGKMAAGTIARVAISAAAAFLVLFIVTKIIGNSYYDSFKSEMMDDLLYNAGIYGDFIFSGTGIFSTSSQFLVQHLLPLKFTMEMFAFDDGGTGTINLAFSFLSNLLLPAVVSLIAGGVIAKFFIIHDMRLKASVVYGAVYAILLAVLTLFVGESFSAEQTGFDFQVEYSYSFFSALLNGFLISFLFSWIGMKIVHAFRGQQEGNSIYSFLASKAVTVIAAGLTVAVICAFVGISNAEEEFFLFDPEELEYEENSLEGSLSMQAGAYLLGLSNFDTFKMEFVEADESEELEFSLFGGLKIDGEELPSSEMGVWETEVFDKIITTAWCLAAALTAFFVWTGMQISKKFGFQVPQILIFSVLYAVLSALVQSAVRIGIDMQMDGESMEMVLGLGSISTFFTCFVFAAVFTILGGWFQKRRAH